MESVYFRRDKKSDAEKEAKKLREQGMKVKVIKDEKIGDYRVVVSPTHMKGWESKKKVRVVEEPSAKELLDEE